MHEWKSKPIQIDGNNVLCQDGSMWSLTEGKFTQTAYYSPKSKKEKVPGGYTQEFESFWSLWSALIRNTCSKLSTYEKWAKISQQERSEAINYIKPYSMSTNEHNYLKRANTYISGKIWESAKPVSAAPQKEPAMPDMNVDLRGRF